VAPPTLAMVPTTFANPSLLAMLVSSSLVEKQMNLSNLQCGYNRKYMIKNVTTWLDKQLN
jgi:hypothetical protein